MASNFELKPIRVEFVSQGEQRYDTVGDYGEDENGIWFKITKLENSSYSIACLIHEIHEYFRNQQDGVSTDSVDSFDMSHPDLPEPGESVLSPYHKQHMEADSLERLVLRFFGGEWADYENAINKLFE